MDKQPPAPWVKYPGFPPFDGFWRQTGEYWLAYVWEPYWNALSLEEKEAYLQRWDVPDVWREYSAYINPEFAKLLESIDNEN